MSNRTPREDHEELVARLKTLTENLRVDLEIRHLLLNLDDPANDEISKDRYTALFGGAAVDGYLGLAIGQRQSKIPKSFDERIKCAKRLDIVTDGQAIELDKIKLIRNVFAHSSQPIGFNNEIIKEAAKSLWDYPVSSWSGYFAPAFSPRHQYAIVCGEFCNLISRGFSHP